MKRNIIVIKNNFVDVNAIVNIEIEEHSITIILVSGSRIVIYKDYPDYEQYEVPEKYKTLLYDEEMSNDILTSLHSGFTKTYIEQEYHDGYLILTTKELSEVDTYNENEWTKMITNLLNRWTNNLDGRSEYLLDKVVKKIILDYYTLNKVNENIIDLLVSTFMVDVNTIMDIIGVSKFRINPENKIEIIKTV